MQTQHLEQRILLGSNGSMDGGDNRLYLSSGNQTSVVNRLTIQRDDGNVGIGTVAPAARLHVLEKCC